MYGTDVEYGQAWIDPNVASEHRADLVDLECDTTYHFSIISLDENDVSTNSGDRTFHTGACAYDENGQLANLLLAPEFKQTILDRQAAWREVIVLAAQAGIPVPAFSASLDYFDSYRRDRLPQNLTQAQRDYFGAHTYERVDEPRGNFVHHEWTAAPSKAAV